MLTDKLLWFNICLTDVFVCVGENRYVKARSVSLLCKLKDEVIPVLREIGKAVLGLPGGRIQFHSNNAVVSFKQRSSFLVVAILVVLDIRWIVVCCR